MKHIDRESQPPGSSTKLHPLDFEVLRDMIHELSGIYFPDNKRHILQSRIMNRLNALGMYYFEDYVAYVNGVSNLGEILRLLDVITATDTSFFHSNELFACLQDQVLPSIIKRKIEKDEDTVRIWSAACSSGEEAYSIALIIEEVLGPAYPTINFEITGSDINTISLQTAEEAIYKENSLQKLPFSMQDRYFSHMSSGYQLDHSIMERVTFKRINLSDRADMMRMHGIDLVLCANVLQTFSHEAKQKTLQAFYNCLGDEGYLMTGISETLYGLSHPLLEFNINGIQVYQKYA